jgi:DNA replication protein DnaC
LSSEGDQQGRSAGLAVLSLGAGWLHVRLRCATTATTRSTCSVLVSDLLRAEISEKQARSIRYQITNAKLPLAKDVDEFRVANTPINEALVRDLVGEDFLTHQRNVVLVGGTGTGKTHLAIAIARDLIRDGRRGRFFNVVELVNKPEAAIVGMRIPRTRGDEPAGQTEPTLGV